MGLPQADVPLSTLTGEGAGSPQELSDFVWELDISPQPGGHTDNQLNDFPAQKLIKYGVFEYCSHAVSNLQIDDVLFNPLL